MLRISLIQTLYENPVASSTEEADRLLVEEHVPFFSKPLKVIPHAPDFSVEGSLDHALACLLREDSMWVFLERVVQAYPHVSEPLRMPLQGLPEALGELARLLSIPLVRESLFAPRTREGWAVPMPIEHARGAFRRSEVVVACLLSAWLSKIEVHPATQDELKVFLHQNSFRALGYACALIGAPQEHIPEAFRIDLEKVRKHHELVSLGLQMSLDRAIAEWKKGRGKC